MAQQVHLWNNFFRRWSLDPPGWELVPARMVTPNGAPMQLRNCLICGYDENGVRKQNGNGQDIADWAHHLANNTKHQERVRNGRDLLPHVALLSVAPGHPYVLAGQRNTHRCRVCSLTPDGTPRAKFTAMQTISVPDHVMGGPHGRRVGDGRYTIYFNHVVVVHGLQAALDGGR